MLKPLPSVAVDCFSEHLPWDRTVAGSGQRGDRSRVGAGERVRADNSQVHAQRVILGGRYEGLQVVDPTHQEKACEGEALRPVARPRKTDLPTLQARKEDQDCGKRAKKGLLYSLYQPFNQLLYPLTAPERV